MDNTVHNQYRVKKILKISLFSLLAVFLLLVVWGYVRIIPKDIQITNVSSSSFTISWNTKFPSAGSAILISSKNKLPINLSLGNELSYDTRDVKEAELLSASKTSQNVWDGSSYKVDISDFVTELTVSKKGKYYTHHVEVKGLDPESEYSVMIGDGTLFFNSQYFTNSKSTKTLAIQKNISTPVPVYGQVKDAKNEDKPAKDLDSVSDGIVYFNFLDERTGEKSNVFSNPLNKEGSWYIDASTAIDKNGDAFVDKYWNDSISNIWGELVFDLGTLGKWSKTVNVNSISPTELIVINMKNAAQDSNAVEQLKRIDANATPLVKGVSASGCEFVNYCGPCVEYVKGVQQSCGCDGGTLKSRKCGESDKVSLETAIKNLSKGECAGGGNNGDRVQYGGVCKECKDGYWTTLPNEKCAVTTGAIYKPGKISNDTGSTSAPVTGGSDIDYIIVSGDNASGNVSCSDPNGCVCLYGYSNSQATKGSYSIKSGQSCDKTYDIVKKDGKRTVYGSDTTKSTTCIDPDGCTCGGKDINTGDTCIPSPITVNLSNEGKPCVNSSENIAYGVYDSKGVCVARDGKNYSLISDNDLTGACYDDVTRLYATTSTGKMYSCDNGKWTVIHESNASCNEGDNCGPSLFYGNNQCINSNGTILDCNNSRWVKETGATERGAMKIKEINGRESCSKEDEKCLCLTNKTYYKSGEICPEVNLICTGASIGKVCNSSGNTCVDSPSGAYCAGEKASENISRQLASDVIAQEPTTSDYVIDQSTGKVLGIQAGQYVVKSGNDTYAFQIVGQDVPSGKGDILIYIDTNENSKYDEGVDKKISDLGQNITIEAIKQEYKYSLKTGFNFVSFPFLVDEESARTASGLLKMLNTQYFDSIYSIAKYDGNWKVVGQNGVQYDNNDFQLVPGQGYIIKANKSIDITIFGRPVKFDSTANNAGISLFPGWNLIGTYGSNVKKYTAKSLIQSINNYKEVDFTSDNVSRWESDMQMYDGFQLTNQNGADIEYGFDFPINSLQSYFVRILSGQGNWKQDLAQ